MKHGYVTLISILVIGAVGLAISTSLLLLGIGNSRTSFAVEQGNQAKALANTCGEEALQRIRDLNSYAGSDSLVLGEGSCSYTVTNQGGQNRTITAEGEVGTMLRRVEILVDAVTPVVEVLSWQEVAEF